MTQRSPLYVRISPREWPRDLLTWARGVQLGIQPTPFIQRQADWPNPVIARPNLELRTWLNALPPGVVGNPVPPLRNYDWPNPKLRFDTTELRTWLHTQQLTPPIVLPFGQTDWPNPRAPSRNQDVLSWASGLPSGQIALTLPQRQTEWPNPTLAKPPALDLRTWTQGLPPGAIALTIPPLNYDWPNPQPQRLNFELRTWAPPLQLQPPPVQMPFSQFDWPNPFPKAANLELRLHINGLRFHLFALTVPNVVGETQTQGTTDLQTVGLQVAVQTAYSDTVPAGTIISQQPVGGTPGLIGDTVLIVVSLGAQAASSASPAGRHRHRRLFVQIDGTDFEVESAQQAQALLDRAKELARKVALQKAEERLTVHLERNSKVRPKIERPRIVTHNPELHQIVAQARSVISEIYKAAYRDAEIKLRLAAKIGEDDSDDEDLMMLL